MSPRWPNEEKAKEATEAVEPKEELKPEAKAEPTEQTLVIKTEIDAYVASRLKSQPQSVAEIQATDIKENSSATNILKLPDSVQNALDRKNLVPRWLNKDKRAIDRALDVRRWVIVNRTLFPHLPRHYFTANGTIENGDLILACMSKERADTLRKIPGERSSEKTKDLPMNRWRQSSGSEKIGYYKPAYTAERDGETAVAGIVPDAPETNNE